MKRALKIGGGLLLLLIVLLGINAYILNQETKSAEVNAPEGQLTSDLDDVALDLQYTDSPATGSGTEGAPIVLLHCYTCSSRWWDPIKPLLNEEHRVITFDLLGHGGSEKPKSGYEIESQAAAIADALNQLGVSGATVVGHSMGGIVATSLQEQASDLVRQVVIIDSPAESDDGDLPTTADLGTWPILGEAMWRVKLDSMVKSAAESDFAPGTDVSEVFPDDPDRVVDDIDAMTFNSFEDSRSANDDFLDRGGLPSRLRAASATVMVIMGTEDQLLDTDEVLEKFAAIPGVRNVPIEGVGHSPNVEDPEAVAEEILAFVGTAPVVTPPEPPEPPNPPGDDQPGKGGGREDDKGDAGSGGQGGKKDDRAGQGQGNGGGRN